MTLELTLFMRPLKQYKATFNVRLEKGSLAYNLAEYFAMKRWAKVKSTSTVLHTFTDSRKCCTNVCTGGVHHAVSGPHLGAGRGTRPVAGLVSHDTWGHPRSCYQDFEDCKCHEMNFK